ncbi:hypothetical protein N8962_02520 [Flavobacteriales bacterium]|jgi:hypothetical protein|nr:hypothetical protein [Flavobacteriales bacterium]
MKISKVLIPLLLVFTLISCGEDPITKGVITVYDNEGNTVSGATVVLSQEEISGVTQTNVVSTLVSDYNGQTEHILELEALMNVTAFTLSSSNDTVLLGYNVIRLVYGKTIYVDVEILPTN